MSEYRMKRGAFARLVRAKLLAQGTASPTDAAPLQWYFAIVAATKDMLARREAAFRERWRSAGGRRVAYLCMEFLIGRSLSECLDALSVREEVEDELWQFGRTGDEVYAQEADPGLGNGGLGRLAACFLESLSATGYPAIGYSLCYEAGLFRQRIVDGAQVELPDEWLGTAGAWLTPRPELAVTVRFGGRIEEREEHGRLAILHTDYDEVRAVPYDILIPGGEGGGVNVLRLWRAKDMQGAPDTGESQAGYVRALRERSAARELTRSLYPQDRSEEGKLLRLSQQYFLVSASLQNIIAEHFAAGGSIDTLSASLAIHINDTHPALAIPELMRLLLDVYAYSWEAAYAIVRATVSYTNHTVMPEALECWRADLFKVRLPRLFAIVSEINERETRALWRRFPGDFERISRMAVLAYGQVRMANLAVMASHTVNGVSRLHSDILKKTVFSDFYLAEPHKFTSITNGVTHRRWLLHANRPLAALLDEVIGTEYRQSPERLEALMAHREDSEVLSRLLSAKREQKRRFSAFLEARGIRPLDTEAVFDVQIKRMHEYKRQLLNLLKILSLWQEVREGLTPPRPMVFLFGGKAAAGYDMAKELIRLTIAIGEEIARDTRARECLRVELCEEYNVSMAERLIPAADVSEQISLAGKEASGTGCMKLMMNGAITLGTADGANVEIRDAVGPENIYIFGLNDREAEELWRRGYDARVYYRASPRLRQAVDRLSSPIAGRDFSHVADYLVAGLGAVADPYMCLADFESYRLAHERLVRDLGDERAHARRMLVNIARSGRFSSDRSVKEYADDVWHLTRFDA